MTQLDLEVFVKDLDKLFNDMQDKEIEGSALVITAARVIENQVKEIEDLKNANRFIQNFAEEQHQRAVALEMRELTDEEILESFAFYFGSTLNNKAYNDGAILFAKDILRKAQEK
jgi:hypothetical protein